MCLISTKDDLLENIRTTESYLHSANPYKRNLIIEIIRKGKCFICYSVDGELHFAPSKFVGYISNTPETHDRSKRDGRLTNTAIKRILGTLDTNEQTDLRFIDFVKQIQKNTNSAIVPSYTRKYWNTIIELD